MFLKNREVDPFIRATVIVVIVLSLYSFWIIYDSQSEANSDYVKAESICKVYITKMEYSGCLTDIDESDLYSEISKLFENCEIKATESKVNSGDTVYLNVDMSDTNLNGGIINKKNMLLKGTAK